jgi:hypothetical protein
LISDDNTITIFKSGKGTGTNRANPNSKESDAFVYVDLTASQTLNTEGSKGTEPFITLGHELKHAEDIVQGENDRSVIALINPDSPKPKNI